MNFELGKEYIVKVSEEGIIPIEEFKSERFFDKDNDDLDFLTDEEKKLIIDQVLGKIRAEIAEEICLTDNPYTKETKYTIEHLKLLEILDNIGMTENMNNETDDN